MVGEGLARGGGRGCAAGGRTRECDTHTRPVFLLDVFLSAGQALRQI